MTCKEHADTSNVVVAMSTHSYIIKINKMKSNSNTPTNLAIAIMHVVDYGFFLLKIVSRV